MKYILVNIKTKLDTINENILDNDILKEIPFNSKHKTVNLEYDYVMLNYIDKNTAAIEDINQYTIHKNNLLSLLPQNISYDENILYSIYFVFKEILFKNISMSIFIQSIIEDKDIQIFYTDGSAKLNEAAYACCKLLPEKSNIMAYDILTEDYFSYEKFSGKILTGTNNVGELTAIKTAVDNMTNKTYQIIISDSIYGLKSFREYIYNWEKNGYNAYNKKPIKNKELIIEIYDKILKKENNIILFKWTKGHKDTEFNNICDKMAKSELGIEGGN